MKKGDYDFFLFRSANLVSLDNFLCYLSSLLKDFSKSTCKYFLSLIVSQMVVATTKEMAGCRANGTSHKAY